jgi:hypothetical protein
LSHTVEIPGGTAELLDATEMTPRRIRAMEVIQFQHPDLMAKLSQQDETSNPDVNEDEANVLLRMKDATLYAQLASWTLDIPRPETVDAVQDIPLDVYNALTAAIMEARVTPDTDPNSFEPNDITVADDAAPFPSSGLSKNPSRPTTSRGSRKPPVTA